MTRTSASSARAGTTLTELLLVLLVLGLVLGLGAGALSSLDFERARSAETARSALRAAREAARARAAPAAVRVTPERDALVVRALAVVGTWRFEGDLAGAFGLSGSAGGARLVPEGRIGGALELAGGARATFPAHEDPAFDVSEGFSLDCALWVAAPGRAVDAGGAFGLDVTEAGAVAAWLTPELRGGGAPRTGGRVSAASPAGALPFGRWVRVRASYDRRRLAVEVDGALVAETAEDAPVAPLTDALALGGERFAGRVDDLVVGAWTVEPPDALPDGVRVADAGPDEVLFDGEGRLARAGADPGTPHDPGAALAGSDLELALVRDDGRVERVRVSPWGTVE